MKTIRKPLLLLLLKLVLIFYTLKISAGGRLDWNFQEILKNINANEKTIRFDLGRKVRNQLRIIPELRFFLDDSLDYLERIDELLKK